MPTRLTKDERIRYRRQLIMPEIGVAGQERIKAATVLIAGVGGLGGLSATYMAAAGVGTLRIVDMDRVAVHNLNRQVLYTTDDIGKSKAMCAQIRLSALNPSCQIEAMHTAIDPDAIDNLAKNCDLIIDGSDTFETRAVLNRAALTMGIPYVFGGVNGFDGMAAVFSPGHGPCLSCLFPKPPATAGGEIGIIGPTAGMIASLQCMEAIKLLIGRLPPLTGMLIHIHGLEMRIKTMRIDRNPKCPECG